jgi:hypothetical protein
MSISAKQSIMNLLLSRKSWVEAEIASHQQAFLILERELNDISDGLAYLKDQNP